MPKKEASPLQTVTKDTDALKKKVNKFKDEANKLLNAKKPPADKDVKIQQLYERCKETLDETKEILGRAEDLEEEAEPGKVKNFDNKKANEVKRLTDFQTLLEELGQKLEPDDVEASYFKKVQEDDEEEDSEEEDGEEEDDEEEDEEEDEEKPAPKPKAAPVKPEPRKTPAKKPQEEEAEEEEEDEEEESEEEEEEEEEEESEEDEPVVAGRGKALAGKSAGGKAAAEPPKPAARHPELPTPKKRAPVVEESDEEDDDDDDDEEDDEDEEEEDDEDDEEEEDEEDDEDEEEDEESDEEEDEVEQGGTMQMYEALGDFEGENPDDLAFTKGDILTVFVVRTDGWYEAENSDGKRGLVPSTFLKLHNKYKGVQQEEDDEEEDSDDGKTPRSGRKLWKNIKKAVKETSVTDVLHAMGAVPAGFRDSTLCKLATQDLYTMKNYLAPKLSPSCMAYKDLYFNPDTNRVRGRSARVQRIVSLVACRQIPLPGAGVEILSRHIRVCLFDGKNFLSNIHTIRIANMDKEQKTWNFNTKVTESMKSVEFGEFFVRTSSSEANLGILFELCMTYIRTSTGQSGDFSCGWVHLPLFDENSVPQANKTYDLFVNGGTPFEKGVDVDPTVGRREKKNGKPASTNLFRSLVSGNRQPRLVVRLAAPTKDQKDLLDTLPDVLVSRTSYIQYLSFYRQLLTDALIRDREDDQSTELIHNPVLVNFPTAVDQTDFMDVLRVGWAEKLRTAKRTEKPQKQSKENNKKDKEGKNEAQKDQEALKELFVSVFMDQVYPLIHSASIPPLTFGHPDKETDRVTEIQRLLKLGKDKKAGFASLLSSQAMHKPFDISELAFNVIGPFCQNRQ